MTIKTDITWLYNELNTPMEGRTLIDNILKSAPARRVGGGTKNMCVRFTSTKMKVTIQAESHTVELPFIWECEYDSQVIMYLDQPTSIRLRYISKSGRMIGAKHTPDFLVITKEGIYIVECKPEETLALLAKKQPNRYIKGTDGRWRSPPAEEALRKYGIEYRIRSSAETNFILQRNLTFLWDYFSHPEVLAHEESVLQITNLLETAGKASLAELFSTFPDIDKDTIYSAIAHQQFVTDMENSLLIEPYKFWLYSDIDNLKTHRILREFTQKSHVPSVVCLNINPGNNLTWNNVMWTIQNVGKDAVYLANKESHPIKLPNTHFLDLIYKQDIQLSSDSTDKASIHSKYYTGRNDSKGMKVALRRYESISKYIDTSSTETPPAPSRSQRRHIKSWREAEAATGNGFLGLYCKTHNRGNRDKRLSPETNALMGEVRDDHYLQTRRPSKTHAYGILTSLGKERGIYIPSEKIFYSFLNQHSRHDTARTREGRKSAYILEPFHYSIDKNTPIHGDRPFETVHIDHTELDVELLCSQTGRNLGRPWFSIMIDAYSRVILAYVLTFEPPSTRTLMLLTRYCVKKHGRLPNTLVVDQGREFTSVYFEQLAAMTKMIIKLRPASKGRFGSICERYFGVTNTQFIHTLCGNTQNTKSLRTLTPETDPKLDAVWTLEDLDHYLKIWLFDTYQKMPHSSLLATPEETMNTRLLNTGLRGHKFIAYDHSFYLLTLPQVSKGTRRPHPVKGIKVNYIYYWNNALRHLPKRTKIEVRYDPYDFSKVYAYVNHQWVQCDCAEPRFHQYFSLTGKHDTEELLQRMRRHNTPLSRLPSILLEFQSSARQKEALLRKQLRERANTSVHIENPPQNCEDFEHDIANSNESQNAQLSRFITPDYQPKALEVTNEND